MTQENNPLDKYIKAGEIKSSERFKYHLANKKVSVDDYRKNQRSLIFEKIKSKKIIYLDTNAWKCLSDYARGKPKLTEQMIDFAKIMNSNHILENCVFPMGATTLFELQAMEDPASISTLVELVEKFSMNVGCQPPNEITDQELAIFNLKTTRDADAEPIRFCHPMDITGKLEVKIPSLLPPAESLAFEKTALDILYALPTAAHLEMATMLDSQWDNTEGIEEMNSMMDKHQHELKTFPDALLMELTGTMKFHVPDGPPIKGYSPQKAQALMAMCYWHDNPNTRHLITARIQANLHAAVRHIKNRRFKKGDIADFITAQIALPSAHAFFTDRALANLLREPTIGLVNFCSCELVSGFDSFTDYLKAV